MKHRTKIVWASAGASLVVLLGTRIPGQSIGWALGSGALALGLLGAAWASVHPRGLRWAAPAGLLLGLGLLATPTSLRAPLHDVPPALAVLPLLLFFHYAYGRGISDAPRIESARGHSRWSPVARHLPLALLILAIALLPLLSPWILPDRVASAYELQSAAGPVVWGLVIVAIVLAVVLLRRILSARTDSGSSFGAASSPATRPSDAPARAAPEPYARPSAPPSSSRRPQ